MITQRDIDDFTGDALDSEEHSCNACNDTGEGQAPDSTCQECSNPRKRKYQDEP